MQSGGTNSLSYLYLGNSDSGSGTYTLSGSGWLSAAEQYIGVSGSGGFTQSGGTNSVSDAVSVGYAAGSSGTYSLSGSGLLLATDESIGDSGRGNFVQPGGTNSLSNLYLGNNAGGSGTYTLSGDGRLFASDQFIGVSGSGSFTQSGGTIHFPTRCSLDMPLAASGTYSQSGGLLNAPNETIGYSGSSFNQTGGSNVTDPFYLAYNAGSFATYNLSGTGLLTSDAEYIGYARQRQPYAIRADQLHRQSRPSANHRQLRSLQS